MRNKKLIYTVIALLILISIVIQYIGQSDFVTKLIPASALLPDGGRYYGELKDNLFTDEGKILWSNGASYHGQFKQGLFHGNGKLIDAAGNIYEGQFTEGVLTGQGKVKSLDGSTYQGQFENYHFNGYGRWESGKDSHYVGEFNDGLYHGYGALIISDGNSYNGNFVAGRYHGQGEIHYADGNTYKGLFKDGKPHGKGIYTTSLGTIYEGDFVNDDFTGKGVYLDQEGNRYEGGFNNWTYAGTGRYSTAGGNLYAGEFEDGSFTGKGEFKGKDGRTYQGEFENWMFSGEGTLHDSNGDHYKGQFNYGKFDGRGVLTYAAPQNGKAGLNGQWSYGRYIGDGSHPDPRQSNVEKALYVQNRLLKETTSSLFATDPNRINLYFVGIGGDGKQNVFYNEISYIRKLFDESFDTLGRSAILVNNTETVNAIPLATITSIKQILTDVANKMDSEKDILFLYLTSHGSKEHQLVIDQHGLSLPNLPADQLGKILSSLPIRWKVIVISACYSGGFIAPLEDDHTMIITAAAHDRTSFGCSDEAEMTYFGRAYFKESLTSSPSFKEAFENAKTLVHEWEEKEFKDNQYQHSKPQISSPKRIINYLIKWRKQLNPQQSKPPEFETVHTSGL
ncbi:MAG: C13 family peptidase [Methylococcales bacterium]